MPTENCPPKSGAMHGHLICFFGVTPSLEASTSKEVYQKKSIWSARTALGYRVLGRRIGTDKTIWFWIGSHAEYDTWFRRLKRLPA